MSMYVCKTLFKHASLDNYLQLFSTRGVTQIKYIESLIKGKKNNISQYKKLKTTHAQT